MEMSKAEMINAHHHEFVRSGEMLGLNVKCVLNQERLSAVKARIFLRGIYVL
jgi:hypothetical protein